MYHTEEHATLIFSYIHSFLPIAYQLIKDFVYAYFICRNHTPILPLSLFLSLTLSLSLSLFYASLLLAHKLLK